MRLLKRASGAFKDKTSLFKTRLAHRSTFRNPDIEKAVIKATCHDESYIDFRHTQCVFAWIRLSDEYIHPTLWAISSRLEKTHNWVVALKGLMLMHGVFCCKVPAVQTIGRLPFDLSNFKHGYSGNAKRWSFEAFIRAYYGFLEQKSMFLLLPSKQQKDENKTEKCLILQDLVDLQKLQRLLDVLLQIKPRYAAKSNMLVLEAMDCLVVESFDIYSCICIGISSILVRIYSSEITEAKIMLTILEKAMDQSEKLSQYLDFCRHMGVINASECPKVEQISISDIQDLENYIKFMEEEPKCVVMEENAMTTECYESNDSRSGLETIITDKWEVFGEDNKKPDQELQLISLDFPVETGMKNTNPFLDQRNYTYELPDLISF